MILKKFRVTKFRSVQDSGWIDLDMVNALLGENESGKTNLLLPLWKLNPANDGKIDLLSDAPRSEYTQIKNLPSKERPVFINAIFECSDSEAEQIAAVSGCEKSWTKIVDVKRRYDGIYLISFPNENLSRECEKAEVFEVVSTAVRSCESIAPNKTDETVKQQFIAALSDAQTMIETLGEKLSQGQLDGVINRITRLDISKASKSGGFTEVKSKTIANLEAIKSEISKTSPSLDQESREQALRLIPNFIYYSNYGNLDSEIYLPYVLQNMERSNLGEKELAKARTLKVLFEYVKLKPEEILKLGKDFQSGQNPTQEEVDKKAKEKKERSVLLDSAATHLTKNFKDWWKQGRYVFKFDADGDHFRIWVSDFERPEPIELESRSAGLQWFFSFFLVFLNEKEDAHYGSILLLDEPGVTLHPMAQKDLFKFFEGLSGDNQIIYTTHSPFLMDCDKLDQVKAVYIDDNGNSCVSSDLRARANATAKGSEQKAIFPVHSAIGISVSAVLFVGCKILLVEGPSDQYYLSAIKNILIENNKISPAYELLFVPAGGTKGIKSTAKILCYDADNYPDILLDGDPSGTQTKAQLLKDLYAGKDERVHLVTDFLQMEHAEVEDFCDTDIIASVAERDYRGDMDFTDYYDSRKSIIPQIKAYAERYNLELKEGWKVDIAIKVKQKMLTEKYRKSVQKEIIERWNSFFEAWMKQG